MAIIKYDPFRGFEGLTRRMNKLLSDVDQGFQVESGGFNPRVDITEDENHIYLHAELPGLNKNDVNVSVNDEHMITIKGEKKIEKQEKDKSYLRTERSYGSFMRSFLLPENVNINNIQAKFENGVLEITLNKIEPAKPKEIDVKIY